MFVSRMDGPRWWLNEHRITLRRLLIIAGVLGVSIFAGMMSSIPVAALMIGLPVGIAVLLVFLQRPQLGPLVLIIAGLVAVRGPSDNLNPTVLLLVFFTGLWVLDMVGRRRLFGQFEGVPVLPLVALIGTAVLALLIGQMRWFPAPPAPLESQVGGVAIFALSASAFLMVAYYVKDLRWLKWMVWLLVAIGAIYIFARVLPRPFRYAVALYPWGSTSALFWVWLSAHTFSQLFLNRSLKLWHRVALAALLAATIYAAGVQTFDWRSGWIPPLIAMGTIVVLRWPKVGIVLAAGAVFASPFVIAELIAGDAYSYSTRVEAWVTLLNLVKVNPITGLGPSNYYWYTPLFRINGYNVNFSSHNQYVDLIAQTGILGLLAYLWFFAKVGLVGWRLKDTAPDGFAHAYVYACLGGLAAMIVSGMLGDWVLPFVYNVGMVGMRSSILGWLYLGGLVALARILDSSSDAKAGEQPEPAAAHHGAIGRKRLAAAVCKFR